MISDRHETAMSNHKRAVGVFSTRQEAEHALHELSASGFNMNHVSVIARDAERNQTIEGADVKKQIGNKADEGAGIGALSGGALGGLTGLLVGLGTLAIPGIGPVMLAGEVATTLATALAGGAIGAASGGLIGGLVGLGIPEREARAYSDRVDQGDYLVIVDGDEDEVRRAEAILNHQNGLQDWAIYNKPMTEVERSTAAIPVATPLETSAPLEATAETPVAPVVSEPIMHNDDDSIKLYEERVIVDKDREKTGEVSISKHIETETARVSVPVEHERIVIERVEPTDVEAMVVPSADAFQEGTVVHMDVYEETADIQKEAFVREEVRIRKEVEQQTVSVEETRRREELDINLEGHPMVDSADAPIDANRGLDDRR
jgi:uncharacterized protein (TIGR02271 family)